MKKTLLATAIAGALGASAAAQAATVYNQDGTQLDIYGDINYAWVATESGGETEDEFQDNGSTLGFTGQHVINAGVTGYFDMQFDVDGGLDEENSGGLDVDQAFLGAKGNFGDVRLGTWDDLIDDWVQDPITNNETFDVSDSNSDLGAVYGEDSPLIQGANSDREGDKIQYLSPSFNGLQFAIGTQYKGDAAEFDGGNFIGTGTSVPLEHNDSNASFFGGLKYEVGALSVAAVYDDLNHYELEVQGTGETAFEAEAYGLNAQYTIDALRVAAKYERTDVEGFGEEGEIDRYALGARYGYGFGDVYGAYQYVDASNDTAAGIANSTAVTTANGAITGYDGDDSFNEVIVGATYNITSSLYTFAEAAWLDRENDEGDGVSIGAVYAF